MPEPIFDTTTERVYAGLPDIYRNEDINQSYQFKKWLSGICGQLFLVDDLIEDFSYTPPEDGVASDTSSLVDPTQAAAAWLPWLAQLVGVKLDDTYTEQQKRDRISIVSSGFKPGTKAAIAEAAKKVLTGTKYVTVHARSTSSGIGAGGQWDVLIVTIGSETSSDPVASVIAQGAKPAGVKLWHTTVTTTWTTVHTEFPTWAEWNAATWQDIHEAGF